MPRARDAIAVQHGGRSRAQHFAVDRHAATLGGIKFLQHQRPRAFAQDHAGALQIEGSAGLARLRAVARQLLLQNGLDRLCGMDVRARGTGDDDIGAAAGDIAQRFADRQVRRSFSLRQRVVRAAQVVVDRQVRRRHVGQIF